MFRERIIVPIRLQSPFKHRLPMFEYLPMFEWNIHSNFGIQTKAADIQISEGSRFIQILAFKCRSRCLNTLRCLNETFIQTLACSNIGGRTSASMVAEVSLFQVADVPMNRYDYTLPFVYPILISSMLNKKTILF